ncbi:GM11411 [Drosophila sechellia]|uniref:GM11411 n=1 Tax=Drosophila sechellia TaxID=7238 RepID=B4IDM6_DROSE|nr:GM11411 [Drosophila sechellia]
MAAQSRRQKNRRPRCSKTMSLAALILGLVGLTMVTLAAGNDAISAPKAGRDQQQQQRHQQTSEIEDDGGARPDKDFDFAAYVNGECLYGYFSRG